MRVLFVINGLGTGGAERSTAELLPALRAAGIEPRVACLQRRVEGVHDAVVAAGFQVDVLRGRTYEQPLHLRAIIRRWQPDIVHSAIFEADVMARLAALGRAPVLTSLVNEYDPRVRALNPQVNVLRLRAALALDGFTARHATRYFHAISETVKRSAVTHLGLSPTVIAVVPRGRDPRRLGRRTPQRRAAVRARLGLAADHQVVLSVGRQEYQKGQIHLLRAWRHMARSADEGRVRLLLAGRDGNATPALRAELARAGPRTDIAMLGHRDDVPDLMCAADVLAFPSLYEGLGGTLLEAMALELPVVASRLPAVQEVLPRAGHRYLVAAGDEVALAQQLAQLLQDRAAQVRLADLQRRRFLSCYTWQASTQGMLGLYHRLAPADAVGPARRSSRRR